MKKILFILIILVIGVVSFGVFFVLKKEKPVEFNQKGGETEEVGIKMEKSKILMVLAPQDFRDEEYQKPRQILEQAGGEITVASKGVSEARGLLGAKAKVDKNLNEVKADDYDAVVFIGGPGASIYFDDQQALSLAEAAYNSGKIVGAICIAPSVLANAGLLQGKRATAFSSEKDNLTAKGAQYTGESATVDGKIITANGPGAAEEFGKKLVEALRE